MRDSIQRTSEHHGIEKVSGKLEANAEARIPDAVDRIQGLFRSIPHSNPEDASHVYRLASEQMHGNIFGTMAGCRSSVSTDTEQNMLHTTIDSASIAIVANYAVFALNQAFESFYEVMGWKLTLWNDSTRAAREHLNLLAEAFQDSQ